MIVHRAADSVFLANPHVLAEPPSIAGPGTVGLHATHAQRRPGDPASSQVEPPATKPQYLGAIRVLAPHPFP